MPTYRTPDVYVEEISVFPPSVAEVETAVPAFVGYTARATRTVTNDLRNVPTRITSLLEFETLFGGAPTLQLDRVDLDAGNRFQSATLAATNTKYLYDSMRLFFDNGGVWRDAEAIIHLGERSGGWGRLVTLARIVPRPLRDWLYRRLARNRYAWFGGATCARSPTRPFAPG
ncbi:MAG: DCC1-like thiol-disulfide oxidoreductase family protein [Proteobacteria bacterium]|nr:DCC1-like thiol-disulfide oxidoreductase family protein [Pseudomonadota bacterium]